MLQRPSKLPKPQKFFSTVTVTTAALSLTDPDFEPLENTAFKELARKSDAVLHSD